jgi:hypothetical protein
MNLLFKAKDGGAESTVTGYWLIESKRLFSIVLLKFEGPSREAFHSHAFSSWSWLLSGKLAENFLNGAGHWITPSFKPIFTSKDTFHKVDSEGTSWVMSFRGPWERLWYEWRPLENRMVTLTSGRQEVV